jgi:hypothetical protein
MSRGRRFFEEIRLELGKSVRQSGRRRAAIDLAAISEREIDINENRGSEDDPNESHRHRTFGVDRDPTRRPTESERERKNCERRQDRGENSSRVATVPHLLLRFDADGRVRFPCRPTFSRFRPIPTIPNSPEFRWSPISRSRRGVRKENADVPKAPTAPDRGRCEPKTIDGAECAVFPFERRIA